MKKGYSIVLMTIIICFYNLGPSIIHSINRKNTSESEIVSNRKKYNKWAWEAQNNYQAKLIQDSLYLWFHLRGLLIDEDHFSKSKFEQWEEIFSDRE